MRDLIMGSLGHQKIFWIMCIYTYGGWPGKKDIPSHTSEWLHSSQCPRQLGEAQLIE